MHVYTTSPPVDGEANEAIVALLAKQIGTSKTSLEIIRGDSGREKTLRIEGNETQIREKLGLGTDE